MKAFCLFLVDSLFFCLLPVIMTHFAVYVVGYVMWKRKFP